RRSTSAPPTGGGSRAARRSVSGSTPRAKFPPASRSSTAAERGIAQVPGRGCRSMSMAKERRRRPRYRAAHWTGRYLFDGASAWRDCTLVDVSQNGAGFEAYMLATDAVPMREVELELVDRADPTPDPIRLSGRVRHLARSSQGHVRVGMEFVDLSELEGRLL